MSVTREQLQSFGGYDSTPPGPDPRDFGLISWSQDPWTGVAGVNPTAGVLFLARVPIRTPQPIVTGLFQVTGAGSGAQLPVNVFLGLYDQNGNRIGAGSAALDTVVQSVGVKRIDVGIGGRFVLPPFVWLTFLIGTQSTTQVQLLSTQGISASGWGDVVANTRYGQVGAGLSALPASFVPSTIIQPTRSIIGGLANA